jgi:hypothetical protein
VRGTCVKSKVMWDPGLVVRKSSNHCHWNKSPDDPLSIPPTVCRSTSTLPQPVHSFVSYILICVYTRRRSQVVEPSRVHPVPGTSVTLLQLELKSFNSHLKKNSVVHSDRTKHVYLNPLPNSGSGLRCTVFTTGITRSRVGHPVLDKVPR